MRLDCDVAVVGSGLGGSLTALLLDRIGLRPVLLDRRSHPRFAVGESSTPTADLVLWDLARRYGLPRLEPLAKYGTWQATYPELICGLKRGFSYFRQVPGMPFRPRPDHANELLVAASADDRHGDTHWLRSDVDTFLVAEVRSAGIPYLDRTELAIEARSPRWRLAGSREGRSVAITARFLIDATGEGAFLPRALGLRSGPAGLRTGSRALFGHFVGVRPWRELLAAAGGRAEDHPFDCDHAALHQVLDEGWMWQLRFNNGVTSAGFALDTSRCPLAPQVSPEQEWDRLLRKYPSLAEQFAGARLVQPRGGLRRTGHLQRRVETVVGENWALLPHTAGFIDPLHSTGIAQTFCGVERLITALDGHWGRGSLRGELAQYEASVRAEIELVDELVQGCYACLGSFALFTSAAMPYFAAATTYEHRRLAGRLRPGAALLCADDPALRSMVRGLQGQIVEALGWPIRPTAASRLADAVAEAISPFNTAGLCDPRVRNMYRYTAVPVNDGPAVRRSV